MRSLRPLLVLLWSLLLVLGALTVAMLWLADHLGPGAQIDAARADVRAACRALQGAHARLVPPGTGADAQLLAVVVDLSLRDAAGVEGGVWDPSRGFVAYAFPTHEGPARKLDVPEAEKPAIEALARQTARDGKDELEMRRGEREALVLAACPLPQQQAAWAMRRAAAAQAQTLQRLSMLSAAVLCAVLLAGIGLLAGLRRWSRRLSTLERSLAQRSDEATPIATTGEPDLDRLVAAFNTYAARIADLRADSQRLSGDLARADRMSALGRLAAGLAHEIRNPLGSMRLRAENALAVQDDSALQRRGAALAAVLQAVQRLESLVGSLLALTRPMRPQRQSTDLAAWLDDAVSVRAEQALQQGVQLRHRGAAGLRAEIDPAALARALDNLLQNALQHTPRGGTIDVSLEGAAERWRLRVCDSGPGIAPELRARLFEPFASGRAEGTGLGLAIAHEIVAGHGGRLVCVDGDGAGTQRGACFEMELPWRAS